MADSERIIDEVNRLYNKIMIPHQDFIGSGNHQKMVKLSHVQVPTEQLKIYIKTSYFYI